MGAEQQATLAPQLAATITTEIGGDEARARLVVTEVLARLTPDMTLSELTIHRTLEEELARYRSNPPAYVARCAGTRYRAPAQEPNAPPDAGRISPDLAALLEPAPVPTRAVPVNVGNLNEAKATSSAWKRTRPQPNGTYARPRAPCNALKKR